MNKVLTYLRVGWFLASRNVRRSSIWTNTLIIAVMMLTFLNLVIVSGLLVGLITGAGQAYRDQQAGDLILKNPSTKSEIQESVKVISIIDSLPGVTGYSPRYLFSGNIEANYKQRRRTNDLADEIGALIAGIDPVLEDSVTNLSKQVFDGEYLEPDDEGKVLIGSDLLADYARSPVFQTLENVKPGEKVRITLGDVVREVEVKGILKSKADDVGLRVYFVDKELRKLLNRDSYDLNEIAVTLDPKIITPQAAKAALIGSGVGDKALVQTWRESQGEFFEEIERTFGMLGNIISSIGLAVSSITIFIVIFINAVSRRKYIGILKGIGVNGLAIEISYVIQAFFYAVIGTILGAILIFFIIQPYIAANPIDFPFSDGILVTPFGETIIRIVLLLFATIIAGYVPAKIIIRQNTLDSILGRR